MPSTYLQDYLIAQKKEEHTYVRTSTYLVSADMCLPCLLITCNTFDKMKCVYFGYTFKIRTYIKILLYQIIFQKNIAHIWQLRDLLAYDAARQAGASPSMSDLAN